MIHKVGRGEVTNSFINDKGIFEILVWMVKPRFLLFIRSFIVGPHNRVGLNHKLMHDIFLRFTLMFSGLISTNLPDSMVGILKCSLLNELLKHMIIENYYLTQYECLKILLSCRFYVKWIFIKFQIHHNSKLATLTKVCIQNLRISLRISWQ